MTLFFDEPTVIGGKGKWNNNPFRFYDNGEPWILGSGKVTPDWKDIILSGNTALTLVNSKANGLNYLKLFGGTEQVPQEYIDGLTLEGKCEQRNLPSGYQLYTSVEADGITYEYSSQNLTQIPCKRIADNVFGLYNYITKVFISEV